MSDKSKILNFLIRSGNIDILKLNTLLIGTTDLNWHFQKKIRLSLTRLPNSARDSSASSQQTHKLK